jgi:hypothetical protein
MQYKEGIVLTAELSEAEQVSKKKRINPIALLGPRTSPPEFCESPYERLAFNDITLFDSVFAAGPTYHALLCKGWVEGKKINFAGYANLRLEIADSPDEWKLIQGSPNMIIVAGFPEDRNFYLLGKWIDGIPGVVTYAPASNLEFNGLEPFTDWERIERAWAEVARQGHIPAKIAKFSFTRIAEGRRRP